jgi:hypothetical protein
MSGANKLLAAAVALSIALHVAVLFAPSPIDLDWRYEAPTPIEVTLVPPAPVAIAPQPVARTAKKPRARPAARAPQSPTPVAAVSAPGLLTAPPPDGEPATGETAVAESPASPADVESPQSLPANPVADAKPPAEYPLKRARLLYDLYFATVNSGNGATRVGSLTHTWSQDGGRYEAEAVAEASGLVSLFFGGKFIQRSTGQFGAGGLLPDEYTLDRGRGERIEVARFDWTEGKLALAWKSEARTVALPPGAQDPLSMLHQLYFMQPLPASASVDVVTSRKLGRYVYQLTGEETIATPIGSLRTLRFRRYEPDGTTIEVWVDVARNLLPARIYAVDRKGNVLDQVIREVQAEVLTTAPPP